MSQTIVPPAPVGGASPVGPSSAGGTAPARGTLTHRLASASATVRHYLAGSPGRLRLISALAVLAAVLVALGGGAALRERSAALDEANRSAEHLIRVQSVQINLVQANANATNSFLKFGLEPEDQRLEYIKSIQAASSDLALAARASAQDAAALGRVNADLTRYTGYIGTARANNRFGNPVGANYLGTASDLLIAAPKETAFRETMVTELAKRADADRAKIEAAYSRATHASWWLALVALIGLGALIWAQIYLARHSRRILNVPLAGATVGLLVALIAAAGAMAVAQSEANDIRDGSLARATALSRSRVAAFTAKSYESLTLIDRGSSSTKEAAAAWAGAMDTAKSTLPAGDPAAAQALDAYAALHRTINETDLKGDWDAAVKSAVDPGTSAKPSANTQFQAYDRATATALTSQARDATSGLGDAGGTLLPAGILVVIVGLLAAMGAWWGISLRLDEYR